MTEMTLGEALFRAAVEGAKAWIQVPGNYARLSPAVQVAIERGISTWETSQEEANATASVSSSGGSS